MGCIPFESTMIGFNIENELKKLPKSPGVYLMHDKSGDIIYVGKAKNLFNRVHQYFQSGHKRTQKINQMISHIDYFEYIVVDNELESLILEANLIKENMPRYNTLLKDDKNYPYIKITTNENYPRIIFARHRSNDNATYFGPFRSAFEVKELLDFTRKNFKIRSCKMPINEKKNQKRECLYYHIGACLAPCINKNICEEYKNNTKKAIDFLSGKYDEVLKDFNSKMLTAAECEDFEKAKEYRDIIYAIESLKEKQKINQKVSDNRDIIALYKEEEICSFQIFCVRDGKIIDRLSKFVNVDIEDKTSEIMEDFIKQYYNDNPFIPREILVSETIDAESIDLLEKWLSRDKKYKNKIIVPKKGDKEKLISLAIKNAKISLRMYLDKNKKRKNDTDKAIEELKQILNINDINRIESFDISNISGTNSVASMVCFIDGEEAKSEYRKYKIKSVVGADDYKSMAEVLTRRLDRLVSEIDNGDFSHKPDLLLIDGGKGQVNTVLSVMKNYDFNIPICGMVKDDNHNTRGLWYNNKEMPISKELLKFITRVQDETHRFAITFHRQLRSKSQIKSVLDEIKGVGEKRKLELIRKFKTIQAIKDASIEELLTCTGVDKNTANEIYLYFKK